MPTWTIQDSKTGEEFEIDGDREPTQAEAQAALDDFLASESKKKVTTPATATEQPSWWGETKKSLTDAVSPEAYGKAFTAGAQASEGGGPAVVGALNEVLPYLPGTGGLRLPEGVGQAIEPVLATLGGVGGAAMNALKPVTAQGSMAFRGTREAGKRIGAGARGDILTPEREAALRRFTLTGEANQEIQPYQYPSIENIPLIGNLAGQSTVAQTLTGAGTDFANDPINQVLLAKGLGMVGGKGGTPKITEITKVGKESTPALDLLQKQLKPGARSKVGQEFQEVGERGLENLAVEERAAPTKGNGADRLLENEGRSKARLGNNFEEMHAEAEAKGLTFDRNSVRQEGRRIQNQPWYKYVDPEAKAKFDNLIQGEGEISLREAHEILTEILERKRLLDQRVGAGEDVANAADKTKGLNAMESAIKKQLNEKLSRRPNEYLENSANYQSVAQLGDLIRAAKTLARNADDVTTGEAIKKALEGMAVKGGVGGAVGFAVGGPAGAIGGATGGAIVSALFDLMKRGARPKAMGKALDMAAKSAPRTQEPIPPQKPSTLPQGPETSIYEQFPSLTEEYPVEPPAPPSAYPFPVRPMQVPRPEPKIARLEGRPVETYNPRSEYNPNGVKLAQLKGRPTSAYVEATKAPYKPAPWIKDVALNSFTKDPVGRIAEVELARKIVTGGDSKLFAKALKDPETSTWMKNVLRRLSENPETAAQDVATLEAMVKSRFDPFAQTRQAKSPRR